MTVTRKFGPLQKAVVNNNNIKMVENLVHLGSKFAAEMQRVWVGGRHEEAHSSSGRDISQTMGNFFFKT